MRVLFSAHGSYGHVLPMVGLARALGRHGDDVLFATGVDLCPVVAARGLAAAEAGRTDEELVAEARRRWPDATSSTPSSWTVRMFCEIAAPAMAEDLHALMEQWRPDVVVREEGEHGAPVAAAAAGIPWVTHGWGSPLPPPDALADREPLLRPLWERAGLQPPVGAACYGAAVVDPCPPSLYAGPPLARRRRVVRPGEPAATAERAAPVRRSAYVGFGTVPLFRDVPATIRAAVEALLELGFEVTVTTASEDLSSQLRALDPRHVRLERWVDLAPLLQSCEVVVCHGGAGTVLSALAAGVPLVLAPQGAPSQERMSAACEARGVGRTVRDHDVRAAVAEVIADDRFHAAAAEVAAEIAAMPDPASLAAVLAAVVAGEAPAQATW